MSDPVSHPRHYNQHPSGVECIEIARHLDFDLGNAVKYLFRAGHKSKNSETEDRRKALWYLKDAIAVDSRPWVHVVYGAYDRRWNLRAAVDRVLAHEHEHEPTPLSILLRAVIHNEPLDRVVTAIEALPPESTGMP